MNDTPDFVFQDGWRVVNELLDYYVADIGYVVLYERTKGETITLERYDRNRCLKLHELEEEELDDSQFLEHLKTWMQAVSRNQATGTRLTRIQCRAYKQKGSGTVFSRQFGVFNHLYELQVPAAQQSAPPPETLEEAELQASLPAMSHIAGAYRLLQADMHTAHTQLSGLFRDAMGELRADLGESRVALRELRTWRTETLDQAGVRLREQERDLAQERVMNKGLEKISNTVENIVALKAGVPPELRPVLEKLAANPELKAALSRPEVAQMLGNPAVAKQLGALITNIGAQYAAAEAAEKAAQEAKGKEPPPQPSSTESPPPPPS